MYQLKYRKYPRVFKKKFVEPQKRELLNISAITAVGILAFTFVKGMFWGYVIKKRLL
jgi:preprotein translocase subunit Sss1